MKKLLVFLLFGTLASTHIAPVVAQTTLEETSDAHLPASPEVIQALRQKLRDAESRAQENKIADSHNLALWKFKLEQARLLLNEVDAVYGPPSLVAQKALERLLTRADQIETKKGDAAVIANSQMQERAYLATNDGSAQPYWVFLPKNYSPKKKYPLAIFLHGYDPQITKLRPWIPGSATWSLATNRGFIFVTPYGRRNSDFLQIGEDDTLRVLAETQKLYSTDANRIFLMGASMGGYGTLAVGLHTPHLWAGLAPMAARTGIYEWLRLNRDEVLPWKRSLYESDDPRTLQENAQYLPIFLQHGSNDHIVSVTHSREFYNQVKSRDYPIQYREITDGDHFIYLTDNAYQMAFDWAAKLRRKPAPRQFTYATQNLQNNRAYWATIEAFDKYGEAARVEVNFNADKIEIKTQNIAALKLEPPRALIGKFKTLKLSVNGADAGTFESQKPILWSTRKAIESEFPGLKSPQRSGPVREVYRGPFLLVYGNEEDKFKAQRFSREWSAYTDGIPPTKADKDISPLDRKNYNLILFGARETNSLLKEAPQLPVELTSKGYRVGTNEYSKENVGLVMCYPSPWSKERMIIVQSGLYWGDALPINHKFDLLPDYIIFDGSNDSTDNTNNALSAGYFNNQWQIEP